MTPKEKAEDILNKINRKDISPEDWIKASDYAKDDLKRKANIVVDEVLNAHSSYDYTIGENLSKIHYRYWQQVKQEIERI